MNKLKRYWNQNRKQIIKIIAIIVFIFAMMQLVNNLLGQKESIDNKEEKNEVTQPNQSVITGEKVPTEITKRNNDMIKQFVDYCNNKEIQNAYQLLSEDCKAEFHNNINEFMNHYYHIVFDTQKIYEIDLWLRDTSSFTYQIKYSDNNLLETGGSSNNKKIEDYITIVNQNGENKININGFIRKEVISKIQENDGIAISVNQRKIYKNYEKYSITIKNNTSHNILLSNGSNDKDICLLDQNNVQYASFLNEISMYDLTLKPNQETKLDIKFNKIYDINRRIEKVQFNNINLNSETQEVVSLTINL